MAKWSWPRLSLASLYTKCEAAHRKWAKVNAHNWVQTTEEAADGHVITKTWWLGGQCGRDLTDWGPILRRERQSCESFISRMRVGMVLEVHPAHSTAIEEQQVTAITEDLLTTVVGDGKREGETVLWPWKDVFAHSLGGNGYRIVQGGYTVARIYLPANAPSAKPIDPFQNLYTDYAATMRKFRMEPRPFEAWREHYLAAQQRQSA